MQDVKDHLLRVIEDRAWREVEYLAGEFARNAAADREAILAGIEFERWLAMSCREARQPPPRDNLGNL